MLTLTLKKVDIFFKSEAGELQALLKMELLQITARRKQRKCFHRSCRAIADVKQGDASATAWGCDLTFDYVKINADYRS